MAVEVVQVMSEAAFLTLISGRRGLTCPALINETGVKDGRQGEHRGGMRDGGDREKGGRKGRGRREVFCV